MVDGVDIEVRDPEPPKDGQRPPGRGLHTASNTMAYMLVGIGVALLARTALAAGWSFAIGYLYGVLIVAAGIARIYLGRKLGGER